jgi:Na+/proline symporter
MVFGIRNGGGIGTLVSGLGGFAGDGASLISSRGIEIFFGFGLPTTVGLISGPFGDQCFWQRAFSVRKDRIGRAFFVGAILFGVVPLAMGILGFVGAGMGYAAADTGVINFELISTLFPAWAVIPFLFMIVSGLLSTIDSNLCAISSLTTDIFKKKSLGKTKVAMVMLLILGIAVANIPGLTVTHLFLMYGTLRAATLLPTVFTLKGVKLRAEGVTAGIICALIIGLPIFAYGNINGIALYKTIGSLTTVILSGAVALIVSRLRGAANE